MKVTFVFHSSFVVELDKTVLIFDYYGEGKLPVLPEEKQIYFLASHSHKDHYNKEILTYRESFPQAEYILSSDIRLRPEDERPWIHTVKRGKEYTIGPLNIRALRSTDQGVAFVVETEGVRTYHAGDLNWWHWEGEDKAWNNNMAANYKREIEKLEGEHIHLAFVVLDPRLGQAYDWGMDYYLTHTKNDHVFPMHCWQDYQVCRRYEKDKKSQGKAGLTAPIHPLESPGQTWELT